MIRESDVAIVGAGAAGGLYAAQLAGAGKQVVLLEAGPARRVDDLISSQIWARRLKWGGVPWRVDDCDGARHTILSGWGFGGAAVHHYATWPRLHESDFRLHSTYARGRDWPFEYSQLCPFYDRVQEEFGISGDAAAEVWRPPGAPYPLPPLPVFAQGKALAAGFEKLGLRTAPLPRAILSAPYRGRPACLHDGWCDAGCPTGALANPLVTTLPEALRRGATLLAECQVTRILTDNRSRVTGLEYVDKNAQRHTLRAAVVVLAAAPVQSVRLLLASASGGLANSSGKVGTGFMTHGAFGVYGMLEQVETMPHLGTPSGQLLCQEHYERFRGGGRDTALFGAYQWQVALSMKPNDFLGIAGARGDLFGRELDSFLRRGTQHLASMMALVEELPDEANRITLAPEKDTHGVPLPRIQHRFSTGIKELQEHITAEGLAVIKASGAAQAWASPMAVGHLMGGTPMGSDGADSVTDGFGRCHDISNLVIAGAALFPTAGGVNPTFTIHALSLRNAGHLADNWSSYAS